MATAARWLGDFRYPSEDVPVVDHFRHWGYTIYRTSYGPSSDQQWEELLKSMRSQAYNKILKLAEATEDDPNFQKIWSLFQLDARSDPVLSGLDMDQLRLLYRTGEGGLPINADLRSHRVFLVADDEILSDSTVSTVKCVETDYEAANHVGHWRAPQRYFGWMPMGARDAVGLWKHLQDRRLERIAPATIGGSHLVVWEDVLY